jgi:hypothetical protein
MTRLSELLRSFGSALIVVACLACESAFGDSGPLVTAEAQVTNMRRALIAAGDPDSLAAAALVNGTFLMPGALASYIVVDAERLELIDRAANLWPRDSIRNRHCTTWNP